MQALARVRDLRLAMIDFAISTLHFYERKGLISSERPLANHRVFRREILMGASAWTNSPRLSFIHAANRRKE